jgi:cell division protein FtsQ
MTDPQPESQPRRRNRRVRAVPPAPEPSAAEVILPAAPAQAPTRRRVSPRALWGSLSGVLVAGALAASWFALPIRTVQISGNAHLSEAQVRELAGLTPGFAWPYYGAWRARGLRDSPWVQSAQVTRRFPDTVEVRLRERVPFVRWQAADGRVVALAEDGTALPGARNAGKLPLLSGWGPDRRADALFVARALRRYNVQSVAYTPSGLTARTAGATVWSGDLGTLLKYAGAIVQFPDKKLHIYPWGVSVQQ